MQSQLRSFNIQLLTFLQRIGLLENVPATPPPPRTVLARGICPLHDGADNPNAFLLYADGWVCTTRQCHKERKFGCNLHGLVRHLVYRLTDKVMDWRPAWSFAQDNVDELKELVEGLVRQACSRGGERVVNWTREDLLYCLDVPSRYYLARGYLPETLQHFGVGTCIRTLPDGKRLLNWAVIPVWDVPHRPPFGYTARNPHWIAGGKQSKWIHAVNPSKCLFNSACPMAWMSPVIICEGPGCVLRFHEAGLPGAVATLGRTLSDAQYFHLLALLARDRPVYIAGDTDEPGREFAERLKKTLSGVACHDPFIIYPPKGKDFGDATTEEVRQWTRWLPRRMRDMRPDTPHLCPLFSRNF